uniref:Uncharacterized protein n=1 Tax=Ixodes ricinus TaxID=34613 RepID=A0A147BSR3_IXORI
MGGVFALFIDFVVAHNGGRRNIYHVARMIHVVYHNAKLVVVLQHFEVLAPDEYGGVVGAHVEPARREGVELGRGPVHKLEAGVHAGGPLRQSKPVHLEVHLNPDRVPVVLQLVTGDDRGVEQRGHGTRKAVTVVCRHALLGDVFMMPVVEGCDACHHDRLDDAVQILSQHQNLRPPFEWGRRREDLLDHRVRLVREGGSESLRGKVRNFLSVDRQGHPMRLVTSGMRTLQSTRGTQDGQIGNTVDVTRVASDADRLQSAAVQVRPVQRNARAARPGPVARGYAAERGHLVLESRGSHFLVNDVERLPRDPVGIVHGNHDVHKGVALAGRRLALHKGVIPVDQCTGLVAYGDLDGAVRFVRGGAEVVALQGKERASGAGTLGRRHLFQEDGTALQVEGCTGSALAKVGALRAAPAALQWVSGAVHAGRAALVDRT